MEGDLKEIFDRKKFLNNELQELKGNIRVYCRIRPFLDSEPEEERSQTMLKINSLNSIDLNVPTKVRKY